jgi:hypothetical protein
MIRTEPHNEEVAIAPDTVPATTLIDLIRRQTSVNLGERNEACIRQPALLLIKR